MLHGSGEPCYGSARMHQDQRRQMLRLSAAAAIQMYAGLLAIPAWELAGKMPESVQVAVRDAAAGGIRSLAERQVRAVLDAWATTRTAAQPVEYPSFSEEVACTRRPALE